MALALTPKQQQFLDYLERILSQTGKAPSLRQAAADLGVSHTAISQLLKALENKGVIKREGRYSRNILMLDHPRQSAGAATWRNVPIVGQIAAGLPLYAQQEWGGTLVVDAAVYRGNHLFALQVKGDSMREAAILDGDLVICEPRQYARHGEIVVALIYQEEATVKRFFLGPDYIELQPENPAYQPKRYGFDDILIQGKVIGVQRGPEGVDHGRNEA
jgi:repressor LexA